MSKQKKIIIIIVIILAILCVVPVVTSAIYISQNYHNAAIAAGATRQHFSGDFLQITRPQAEDSPILAKTYKDDDIELVVFNYPYGIPTEFNSKDITYNIKFEILSPAILIADESYSVRSGGVTKDFENKVVEFTGQTLAGKKASSTVYNIKVPEMTVIYVTVTPSESNNLSPLYGKLQRVIISDVVKPVTIAWSGEFMYNDSLAPSQYSAFEYQITGSGVGKYNLTWDNTKLFLDENCLEDVEFIKTIDGTKTSVKFDVDSSSCEMYKIRFFKLADLATWEEVNACIDIEGCYLPD